MVWRLQINIRILIELLKIWNELPLFATALVLKTSKIIRILISEIIEKFLKNASFLFIIVLLDAISMACISVLYFFLLMINRLRELHLIWCSFFDFRVFFAPRAMRGAFVFRISFLQLFFHCCNSYNLPNCLICDAIGSNTTSITPASVSAFCTSILNRTV